MRRAMAEARVGDDVFGDDPTVAELERVGAALLGKEASLFLPSGTMANQVAVRCHTRPGDEVLLHEGCHTFRFEQGGLAALHGVQAVPLPGDGGQVPVEVFGLHVRPDDPHFPRTRLVVCENTHNLSGGRVLPKSYLDAVGAFAGSAGLAFHVDGARVLNAAATLGAEPAELLSSVDSVTLCLSKGLGAPVGTLLAGSGTFIAMARRARKLLGGGMRQVGILAAAALIGLDSWRERLNRDHIRARTLAAGLGALPGLETQIPETNIVICSVSHRPVKAFVASLAEAGLLVVPFGEGRVRLCTHRDVDDGDVARAVDVFGRVLQAFGATSP